MKVTIPEIDDNEVTDILRYSGMADADISSFLENNSDSCSEKMRILRRTRNSLLDAIHEKQSALDRLDYLIWCTERRANGGAK
ncbi:MAG: hypothetical protein K6G68_10310 [Oscillospiraceae bacterium]|nr:hypothetical protein [Oscillospiraceae bacterium]